MMVRLLALAALLSGCGAVSFTSQLTGVATVPAGSPVLMLGALPLIGALTDLDFDLNPDFRMQAITRAEVVHALVETAEVKVVSPPQQDFGFLDTLQLVARSGDSETTFAEGTGISAATPVTTKLQLMIIAPEITAQIANASMSFVMRGQGRQPANDTRLEVNIQVRVQAARK